MAIVNDNNQAKKRTSKGKQKIEIKKIEKKTSRQVAFTKRRNGLFRKCSKLCSDFGSQFAVITFSETGKPFVSGYPSPDAVIQRYVNDTRNNNLAAEANWWDAPIDVMSLDELEAFKTKLEGLRNGVQETADAEFTDSCIDINDIISSVDQINDTQIIDFGCTDDASNGVHLSDFRNEITGIVNVGSNNSSHGAQESTERFDFGFLGSKASDYFEWMEKTVPEIYPELLPVHCPYSFEMTNCG